MKHLLPLALLACQPALPGPRPPPATWQINLDNARGMGASFDVGDLNHDGLTDLAFAAPSEYGVQVYGMQVWLGSGGAFSFGEATIGPVNPTQAGTAVAICDLDGDGWSEIAVGEPEGPDCGLGAAPACPTDTRRGRIALYRYGRHGLELTPFTELLGLQAGDQLGLRVLCPGDVDHDGHDDLVATAPRARRADGGEGLVLLYRGGAAGISPSPAWSAGQQGPWAAEGETLAVADMNRDGWLDVLTGAPDWDETWTDEGRVALYLNGPAGLPAAPSQVWLGGAALARFGGALAAGPDVDGDGHSELLVGAPSWDSPFLMEVGQATLFMGSSSGPAARPAWSWQGQLTRERLGSGVALADHDGDGRAEVLLTAGGGFESAPTARVTSYPGGPAGPDLTQPLWWRGAVVHTRAGARVAEVGDLDGDGLPDLMTGVVSTVNGQAQGLAVIPGRPPAWDGDGDGVPERRDCDDHNAAVGARGVEVPSDEVDSDCDGRELCRTDRDGDGHAGTDRVSADSDCRDYPETLTLPDDDCDDDAPDRYPGAPDVPGDGRRQSCTSSADRCFVDGDGDGFPADAATVASVDGDCDDRGEAPDARQIWATRRSSFGRYLTAAGDVDGDGDLDLVLEDSNNGRFGLRLLRAGLSDTWITESTSSRNGAALGDLDGDRLADLAWMGGIHRVRPANDRLTSLSVLRGDLSGLQPRPWVSLPDWGDTNTELHVAPDMDGDGYAELVVGRSGLMTEPTGAARVHVLRGGPGGLDRADGWALSEIDDGLFDPPLLITGDFNADGLGDLFVLENRPSPNPKQIWLYLGGPAGPQVAPGWPHPAPDASNRPLPLAVGDFNADGFDDLVFIGTCVQNISCLNVFQGRPEGLPATPDLREPYTSFGGGDLGLAVTAPGDLDGDGFPDLLLSTWDLGDDELITLFGSARGLVPSTATRGLESLPSYALQPAGPAPLGAAAWSVGESYGGYYAARIDVRWLAPDCDDRDPDVHAAAWDAPGDGVDADCDGYDTCWLDEDGDCLRDPAGRVTPDVSGRCDGPREAPAGASVDPDDHQPRPITPVAALAVGRPTCVVALP